MANYGDRKAHDKTSTHGRQPFMELLRDDRRSVRWFGERLGFEWTYVGRVGYGRVAPSVDLRKAVSRYFGKPVGELFTASALEARYIGDQG